MQLDKEIFNLFDRESFVYRKGDEDTKNQYTKALEKWTQWCIALGKKVDKFDTPNIKSWQNSGYLEKDFWTRLKITPFKNSAACVSLHINKDAFTIELAFEVKNKSSVLSIEEFNTLLISNLKQWAQLYNIDNNLFYITGKDIKCTLSEYFNNHEKSALFTNVKEGNINVGVSFTKDQVLELDTESKDLINILRNLSYLYEMVQKPNHIYDQLKNKEELIPDKYDGSYQLVREVVSSYEKVPNENLTLDDLDAMFFMCIGTFKHGVEAEKKLINKSNLPEEEKSRILELIDEISNKALNSQYTHTQEGHGNFGMFGESVGSLRASYKDNDDITGAKDFIRMCTNINKLSDEEEILTSCEKVLKSGVKGMQTGKISKFLHCLKPYLFPIINEKQGEKTGVYDALGIELNKPEKAVSYIENVRRIKNYRDKYFKFKNYIIMDLVKDEPIGIIPAEEVNEVIDMEKNLILYGPPGTGKTYNVINKALEIIDSKKYSNLIADSSKRDEVVNEYKQLVEAGQIAFCTFHQSYSYEDFVEGLRSDLKGGFIPTDGIFKQICSKAKEVKVGLVSEYNFDESKIQFHKMSLGDTNNEDDNVFEYCIKNNCVALGWGEDIDYADCNDRAQVKEAFLKENPDSSNNNFNIDAINRFKNWIKAGDIIIVSYGNTKARAIAKVTGDYYYDPNTEIGFNHFRKVQWLYNDEKIAVRQILKEKNFSQQSIYMFVKEDIDIESIKKLVSKKSNSENKDKKYVLIIDEINRGNISKIFGELITLIESDKRLGEKNEIKVTLPYSNEKFGVPNNLYIIGTMNTADRSIALMDTALRRRFSFKEYMPEPKLLSEDVEGINLKKFLTTINSRIEFLFDREHTIGHAYFLKDNLSFNDLVNIMKNKVIPLLQEYFYGDWDKIELILGGAGKKDDDKFFIAKEKMQPSKLFKNNIANEYSDQYKYCIVENPTKEAFINVYSEIAIDEE